MKHVDSEQEDENRRRYFRIDDDVYLYFRVVSKEDVVDIEHQHEDKLISRLTLKARFECLSREMQPLHHRVIDSCSPEIARYLAAVDKKLNMLSEYFIDSELNDMEMKLQPVNIGAGGISFLSKQPVELGSMVELRLILMPENTGIFSYAKVVACERAKDKKIEDISFTLALEFENMSDEIRNLVSRHIISKERESISHM